MISRIEWQKQFKNCKEKALYEKKGKGGTLSRCCVRARYNFVGFNRCMYRTCPRIHPYKEIEAMREKANAGDPVACLRLGQIGRKRGETP